MKYNMKYKLKLSRHQALSGVALMFTLFAAGCSALRWESDASFKASRGQSSNEPAHSKAGNSNTGRSEAERIPRQAISQKTATPQDAERGYRESKKSINSDALSIIEAPLDRDPVTGDIILPSVSETGGVRRSSSHHTPKALHDADASGELIAPPSRLDPRDTIPAPTYNAPAASAPLTPSASSNFEGKTTSIVPQPSQQTYYDEVAQQETPPKADPLAPSTPAVLSHIGDTARNSNSEGGNSLDGGSWGVHLASYRSLQGAQQGWRQLQKNNAGIANMIPLVSSIDIPSKGKFLRLNIGPFTSRGEATTACQAFKQRGEYCAVISYTGSAL